MISRLREFILFCFISYLSFLFYLLFFSYYRSTVHGVIDYNVIPFKSIFAYIQHFSGFSLSNITDNFFGNIFAFLPFGFLLPLLRENLSFYKILIYSCSFSLLIEITQILFRVGAFDVDDIILNSLGGGLGYLVVALLKGVKANEHR